MQKGIAKDLRMKNTPPPPFFKKKVLKNSYFFLIHLPTAT